MMNRLRGSRALVAVLLTTGCESFVLPAITTTTTAATSIKSHHHIVRSSSCCSSLLFANSNNSNDERTKWYACSSTKELTKAVELVVRDTDAVAEIGAQLRDVSKAISANARSAVLVDIVRKFPSDASKKRTDAMRRDRDGSEFGNNDANNDVNNNANSNANNNAVFGEIQSLSDWRKALFFDETLTNKNSHRSGGGGPYDVLVLDVSALVGNDLEWTSFAMITEFLELNACFGGTCRTVLVKSAGLNRLAACLVHGQVWIDRGPASSSSSSSSSRGTPAILATVGVQQYRRTMERAVLAGDAILEVGCHFGTSTVLFHEKASASEEEGGGGGERGGGYCIGIDVGSSIVEGAKKRHPGVYFQVGDAWKTADLLRIQEEFLALHPEVSNQRRGFDVVYVDVGGLSGSDGILEALMLLSSLEQALEPRCLVIKSQCMRRLSSTLTSFWQSPERRAYDRQRKEERLQASSSSQK